MNRSRFFLQLSLITAGILAILFILQLFPEFSKSFLFSIASLACFVLLSLVMFFLAAKAAVSKDKNAFTSLVIGFIFGKLALAVVLVLAYKKIANPQGATFLIPFFLIYLVFAIFENVFMVRLGKIKAR